MTFRFFRSILVTLGLALVLLPLIGCAASAQQSQLMPEAPAGPTIIAIGDIHGDHDAYMAILTEADLIDRKGKWAGGETILVQTGDIPDRGPDTRKIIEHLRKLQKQARKAGGQVITLVGNHEAMMMTGDLRYVHPGEYEAFKTSKSKRLRERLWEINSEAILASYRDAEPDLDEGAIKVRWEERTPLGLIEHQQAWAADGKIGKWVSENPIVAQVGDTLFVHGGIGPEYTTVSVDQMNDMSELALKSQDASADAIINDPNGPLWFRDFADNGARAAEGLTPELLSTQLDTVLAAFGAKRMVIGHTPARDGIKTGFDGRVIQIDTGASAYYGGTRSFLRIEGGKLYAHDNGEVTPL